MYGFYDDKSKADINSIGEIKAFGGSVAPNGWRICNGDVISRTDYSELFGVIGTTYGGGDGSTTFAIPDFRGRTAIGAGESIATGHTVHALGEMSGEETHQLTASEMAAHTHGGVSLYGEAWNLAYQSSGNQVGTSGIVGRRTISENLTAGSSSFSAWDGITINASHEHASVGEDQGHNNMQPFTAINYIIYTGVA